MSVKANIFATLRDRLLALPVSLRTVERYYSQYENENMSKNYPAFDKSAYIDIYEIALREPQKGNRITFSAMVDIYLNSHVSAQSLSINNALTNTDNAYKDWELEQKVITQLHDFTGSGITEMKFVRSVDFQKFDQLFVKRLSFNLITCAVNGN
jgi:hypothetical protein